MFYCTVEMGMSVICVNLPSIWMLLFSKPPDVVIHSMRSVVSIVSSTSKGSKRSKTSKTLRDRQRTKHLNSSRPALFNAPSLEVSAEAGTLESVDLERQASIPVDRIQVSRSVEQCTISRYDSGLTDSSSSVTEKSEGKVDMAALGD